MKNKLVYSNVRNRFEAATNVYDKKNWSLGMLNGIIYFPNCEIFITSTCRYSLLKIISSESVNETDKTFPDTDNM